MVVIPVFIKDSNIKALKCFNARHIALMLNIFCWTGNPTQFFSSHSEYLRWTNLSLVILYSGVLIDQSLFSKKTEQYVANRSSTEEFYTNTIVFNFFLKKLEKRKKCKPFQCVDCITQSVLYKSKDKRQKKKRLWLWWKQCYR